MRISCEQHKSALVMTLSGEMTIEDVDAFRRTCMEQLDGGPLDVVLDFEQVALVDSAGLETMLWLSERQSRQGVQLRLVGPNELVLKILEVTRLERRFNVHDSLESAARSLY